MANNNQIYKMSNAGGFKSLTRYYDMLAGNTTWNPWEPQGAFDALATVNLTANAGSVTFAGIPTGYKHLQIRSVALVDSASNPQMRFNNDTGATYSWHHLYGNGSTALNNGGASQTFMYWNYNPSTSYPSAGIIDILDYSNSTKFKTVRTLAGSDTNGGTSEIALWSGSWQSTAPVTSITLLHGNSGNFTANSSFALYGVK